MNLLLRYALSVAVLLTFQAPGHALSIANLAPVPHQVSVTTVGNHETVVEIPEGRTINLNVFPEAKMKLLTGGNGAVLVGREKDVFAIWPDGSFGPQMKRRYRSKDNN